MNMVELDKSPPEGLPLSAPRLSRAQRRVVIASTLVVAATRVVALAKTAWNRDEMLFMLGIGDYDVFFHRPHPPGYPVLIALGKALALLTDSPLVALQVISVLGAVALFPLSFVLVRMLGYRFWPAIAMAWVAAFVPVVWLYSGSALSGVPALALTVAAVILLLRGSHHRWAYFVGVAVLAVAMGIRPQALVGGLVALAWASFYRWRRRPWDVAIGASIGIVINVAQYGAAALATGSWERFATALSLQRRYLVSFDSLLAATRPPLTELIDTFFLAPFGPPALGGIVWALAGVALLSLPLRADRAAPLFLVGLAAPQAIFAWLLLAPSDAPRYALAYFIFVVFLAIDALGWLLDHVSTRRPRVGQIYFAALCVGVTLWSVVWTAPPIEILRTTVSPPIAAMRWIRAHHRPRDVEVWVDRGIVPFTDLGLGDYRRRTYETVPRPGPSGRLPLMLGAPGALAPELGARPTTVLATFTRPADRLGRIAGDQYFEIRVGRPWPAPVFSDDWYPLERHGDARWRWMPRRGKISLPPASTPMEIALEMELPMDVERPAQVRVAFDGEEVDRWVNHTRWVSRRYVVCTGSPDREGELLLSTDQVTTPAKNGKSADQRELGLRLNGLQWTQVPGIGLTDNVVFGEGWYAAEGGREHGWRWMGRRSVTTLPSGREGGGLAMTFALPRELVSDPPEVVVSLDGAELDRFEPPATASRCYVIPPSGRGARELVIETTKTVRPSDHGPSTDTRALGLKVSELRWIPRP